MTMYSSCDTPKGGFPHSEISGSKLICQLPEAYRRLSRPSSPIVAKASTTCTYSLDPITSLPRAFRAQSTPGQSPPRHHQVIGILTLVHPGNTSTPGHDAIHNPVSPLLAPHHKTLSH